MLNLPELKWISKQIQNFYIPFNNVWQVLMFCLKMHLDHVAGQQHGLGSEGGTCQSEFALCFRVCIVFFQIEDLYWPRNSQIIWPGPHKAFLQHFYDVAAKTNPSLSCLWLFINHQLSSSCTAIMWALINDVSITDSLETWSLTEWSWHGPYICLSNVYLATFQCGVAKALTNAPDMEQYTQNMHQTFPIYSQSCLIEHTDCHTTLHQAAMLA